MSNTPRCSSHGLQLEAALGLIHDKRLILEAPPPLYQLLVLRPGAAFSIVATIELDIDKTYVSIEKQVKEVSRIGATFGDMDWFMIEFVPEIQKVAELDHQKCLKMAYTLVLKLKSLPHVELVHVGSFYSHRRSAKLVDRQLAGLIHNRTAAGETWKWSKGLKDLDSEVEFLASCGI